MADGEEMAWILPAQIPFPDLKARDLEECVYWLLDAMGARDLEWRTGGSGGGAADGGRDLEATFYVPSPDGEMEPQRWWIECKGRKGTVESDEVKSAVNNATVLGDLAYLVIVTNTTFSNPTRDWVKKWQVSRPRPRVKLWDHETLERLLSRHPPVVLRLFSEALSADGLLAVAQQRFWEKLEYTPVRALETFWTSRENIKIGESELVALIANEFAHGNVIDRPWAAQADPDDLFGALQMVLVNMPYLRLRAHKFGIDETPIFSAIAHMILVTLQLCEPEDLAEYVLDCVRARLTEPPAPNGVVEMMLLPILNQLGEEMQDVCSADCRRITCFDHPTLLGADNPVKVYWSRLDPKGTPRDAEPKTYLRLEQHDAPCKVGFVLDRDHSCPLFKLKPQPGNLKEFLSVIERVSKFRFAAAKEKAIEEAKRKEAAKLSIGHSPAKKAPRRVTARQPKEK